MTNRPKNTGLIVPNSGYLAVFEDEKPGKGKASIAFLPFPLWIVTAESGGFHAVPLIEGGDDTDVLVPASELENYLGFESDRVDFEEESVWKKWANYAQETREDKGEPVDDDQDEDDEDDEDDEEPTPAVRRRGRVASSG